jgi:hypothetical protein
LRLAFPKAECGTEQREQCYLHFPRHSAYPLISTAL